MEEEAKKTGKQQKDMVDHMQRLKQENQCNMATIKGTKTRVCGPHVGEKKWRSSASKIVSAIK